MKIIETNINDITSENINESKTILADNIINTIFPLFNEVYTAKLQKVQELKASLRQKNEQIKKEKESIEKIITETKRKQKVSKLLDRIDKMISSGLVYDPSIKHEMVILLKVVEKLSDEKLDQNLNKTITLLNKRFSK